MSLPVELAKSLIALTTEEYDNNVDDWKRNEQFFSADKAVYDSLKKFSWEIAGDAASFKDRKAEAVYVNFPGLTSERFNGVLFSKAPKPDFGTLGGIDEEGTPGSILFAATDGVGEDARSWNSFWDDAMHLAPATKHRWIFVEGPEERPATVEDEKRGMRPYAIEFSPTQVPFWRHTRGQLDIVRVELESTEYTFDGEKVKAEVVKQHYIMSRKGTQGFGDDIAAGGWWIVTDKGEPVMRDDKELSGDWEQTGGKIPMVRLYYQHGRKSTESQGMSHLVRLSLAYMNLYAAFMNDAWESGSRTQFFLGADGGAWDAVQQGSAGGGRRVPVPAPAGGGRVTVFDSGEITASGALSGAMDKTLDLIMRFMMRELTTSPDASGEAKRLELLDGKSPRLAHMASNIEEAQREVIRFFEMRWGKKVPTGTVEWPRDYDMKTIVQKIAEGLRLMTDAGANSPTLVSELLLKAIDESGLGLVGSDDAETSSLMESVREEIRSSAAQSAQANSLTADIFA